MILNASKLNKNKKKNKQNSLNESNMSAKITASEFNKAIEKQKYKFSKLLSEYNAIKEQNEELNTEI